MNAPNLENADRVTTVLLAIITAATAIILAVINQNRGHKMISRPNVHRRSRRTLTKGQQQPVGIVGVTATPSGSTVTLDFDRSVVISGPIPLTVESRTYVSQVVTNQTQVVITMSGTVATFDYALAANTPEIKGFNGEGNAAVAGTFP